MKNLMRNSGKLSCNLLGIVIMLCLLLLSSCPAMAAEQDKAPLDSSMLEESADDIFAAMEEKGYQNGIYWFTGIQDVTANTDVSDDLDFSTMVGDQYVTQTLEPKHIYRVRLLFTCQYREGATNWEKVRLQARFPEVLLKDEVGAIGSTVFNDGITNLVDFLYVDTKEPLRLYYVQDSLSARSLAGGGTSTYAPQEVAQNLLASADGMDLGGALSQKLDLGKTKMAAFDITYRLAAAPLAEEIDASQDAPTDHWLGEKLMNREITPAPARELAIAKLNGRECIVTNEPLLKGDSAESPESTKPLEIAITLILLVFILEAIIGALLLRAYYHIKTCEIASFAAGCQPPSDQREGLSE